MKQVELGATSSRNGIRTRRLLYIMHRRMRSEFALKICSSAFAKRLHCSSSSSVDSASFDRFLSASCCGRGIMAISVSVGSSSTSVVGGLLWRWGGRPSKGRRGGPDRVRCSAVAGGGLRDQYRTLRLQPGAPVKDVKKAFRQLALQYHPDVCKDNDSGVQFHRINEAYDAIINTLRQDEVEQWRSQDVCQDDGYDDEYQFRGMCDEDWDMWEEWMGWEGAGIRDYSSHINPYI